ncbi:hypothetical protein DFP72DRAFT_1069056 [Ephemerocybe angulata]|uniref:Uncharacterized protein n=1 Tax=Ephemerocybe angulata TaxID=980116 RepID=A0A8H6HVA2_9AGAR|nr:hypothetical protein DFP72DRAFT_1069056 [Tulosesus angulatus]
MPQRTLVPCYLGRVAAIPPHDWYIPPRRPSPEFKNEIDKWVELTHHLSEPVYVPATVGDFKTLGVDDQAVCRIRIRRFQPYEPQCPFVDFEQWSLEMRIELAASPEVTVDVGPSPWVHLAFFEGDRADRDAPGWVRNYFVEEFVGFHSRARLLEVVSVLLQRDPTMPYHHLIQEWSYLASNWFNSYLRRNDIRTNNIEELKELLGAITLNMVGNLVL